MPDAGSYAPVTILIEELPGGGTRVAYDTVSSAIAPYGDAAGIAAMGAAMVSLISHAHDSRTPVATAWILSAGAAVVLCATILVSASLQPGHGDPGLHKLLTRSGVPVAAACLAVGAARPAPLLLCLALVLLLGVPWTLAVAHHLAKASASPSK